MTSRLRDVLGVTVGLYIAAVGVLFLLDSTGVHELGPASLSQASIGIAFIALGILAMLAAIRVRRFSRRLSRTFGHVRSAEQWSVEDAVIRTVLGDITLDLRHAELPEGETELTLLCWLGAVQVRVPADLALDIQAQTFVGAVDVLGAREEGLIRDVSLRSDGYEDASRRLRLRLSTVIGEVSVRQEAS